MALSNERVAWFNGKILPESQVVVPFRDSSWTYGDGVFDMTRTFNGKAFRLKEHIQRLFHSLRYTGIDPGLSQAEMVAISEDVLERNRHLLGKGDDFWLGQRVSRGVKKVEGDHWDHYGPNVIVECMPLPLKERATLFRDGIDVIVPSVRRVPPDSLTPRPKTPNCPETLMADREVRARTGDLLDPRALRAQLMVRLRPRDVEHGDRRALPFRRPRQRRRAVAGALRSDARRDRPGAAGRRTLGARGACRHDRGDAACGLAATRGARRRRRDRRVHRRGGDVAQAGVARSAPRRARQCRRQ